MKNVLKLIGLYILIFLVCFALFVALFHTPLLAGMKVLMYRGAAFIIITGAISAVIMGVVRHFWKFVTIRDIIMMFVIFCCVNMAFFILVPVTVERSVSVFMLSYMEQNSDEIVTGTIEENEDGSYSITDEGRFIVSMFRMMSEWFDTDRRLVYPNEY